MIFHDCNQNPFQVQSVLGVVIFLVFSLFHFCVVTVSCPDNSFEQWAFLFYTTYVKQKGISTCYPRRFFSFKLFFVIIDSCEVDGNPEITTNLSEITTPENIFYLELVQVILCLALISTTLLLPKITENVNSTKWWITIFNPLF